MWHQDLLTPPGPDQVFTEFYDVVLSDRAPGGRWSTSPVVVTGYVWIHSVGGERVGRRGRGVAGDRRARQLTCTPPTGMPRAPGGRRRERVAGIAESCGQVGIDDAGRVLLVYDRPDEKAGV